MTWAEFRIRSFAYNRIRKRELYDLRELMFTVYWSGYGDPKKMKKSRRAFWDLEGGVKRGRATEIQIKAIEEAQRQYEEDVKKAKLKKKKKNKNE